MVRMRGCTTAGTARTARIVGGTPSLVRLETEARSILEHRFPQVRLTLRPPVGGKSFEPLRDLELTL